MIHPDTCLRFINSEIGYGVFATALIPKGTIVYVKDLLEIEISPERFQTLDTVYRKIVDKYSYIEPQGNRVLSWDHAKYVNHRCECNTMSTGYGFEIALHHIDPGDEITDEYGLFNMAAPMRVNCGCPGCRKILQPEDIDIYHEMWDRRVKEALADLKSVRQPLWELLDAGIRKEVMRYLEGERAYASVYALKYPFAETYLYPETKRSGTVYRTCCADHDRNMIKVRA